jgi:four helix bundle protein
MPTIKSFEDMKVWQKARSFANRIYQLTIQDPFSRDFKLRDQINGSSGSIMDNIAEGFEREGNREFIQFLSIAKGSVGETRSQLYRVLDRNYISNSTFEELKEEALHISKQLNGLMKYLNSSGIKGAKFMREPDEPYGASNLEPND